MWSVEPRLREITDDAGGTYGCRVGVDRPISVMVSSMNGHSRAHGEGAPLREAPVALDALRSLPGGSVLVFDRELRYVLATGGALKIQGYAPEDLE
jgi:hypothetical protein